LPRNLDAMEIRNKILNRIQKSYCRVDKLLYRYRFRSVKKTFLPDFLGIGIDKAGTTWLYENLRMHPDVFVSRQKELNYFDRDFTRKSLKFYANNFKNGFNKVKGEITPGYTYLSLDRIRFIREVLPDVRLIFLVRNLVEQQWSFAFHQLVRRFGIKVDDVPMSEFFNFFKNNQFYRIGGYTGIMHRWLRHFPAEQFFVGFFEDISQQPKKLLYNVFKHIGVSCDIDWKVLPYNKMIVPPAGLKYRGHDTGRGVIDPKHESSISLLPNKYRAFLEELYQEEIAALRKQFGDRISKWT